MLVSASSHMESLGNLKKKTKQNKERESEKPHT